MHRNVVNPDKRIQHLYQESPPVVFKRGHNSGDLCPTPNLPPPPAPAVLALLFLVATINVENACNTVVPKRDVIFTIRIKEQGDPSKGPFFISLPSTRVIALRGFAQRKRPVG